MLVLAEVAPKKMLESISLFSIRTPIEAKSASMMSWVVSRIELNEVWKTNVSGTPSLSRTVSPSVSRQPASSSSARALSRLNSQLVLCDAKEAGATRRLAVARPLLP
ncbi:hypothetical protein D9M72_514960 [compost metagenome]